MQKLAVIPPNETEGRLTVATYTYVGQLVNIVPVCFSFLELLATKSCCRLPNTQLFSQLL
jgi:hypothetical protein